MRVHWLYLLCWFAISYISKKGLSFKTVPFKLQNESLQVFLPYGIVQGKIKYTVKSENPYYSFEGIPYAVPPIRNLRFRKPVPIEQWDGVIDAANNDVPLCIQITPSFANNGMKESEDCLYINIYTPVKTLKNITDFDILPVMTWIHGGAFLMGVPKSSYYGPDYLLEESVVVVHFGYRLNSFGFLSTGDLEAPGNYGLKDQHLALKWIKSNIRHFGGDPNKITLFGESAGSVSIQYHLLYQKNDGLFQNAISESGSALCIWGFQRNPRKIAFDMGSATGVRTNNSRILTRHLRNMSAKKLKMLTMAVSVPNILGITNGLPFAPTLEPEHDDAFITYKTHQMLSEGNFLKVPYVIGFNSKEAFYGKSVFDILTPFLEVWNPNYTVLVPPGMRAEDIRKVEDEIKEFYFLDNNNSRSNQYLDFINDVYFVNPIMESARLIGSRTPTYAYKFTYEGYYLGKKALGYEKDVSVEGVHHTEEMWYIWARDDLIEANYTDASVRSKIVRMWTNFAKYSDPTPFPESLLDNISWPKIHTNDKMTYLDINSNLRINNLTSESFAFWKYLYKTYGRRPHDTY